MDEKLRVASSVYGVDLTKENSQSKHDRASSGKNQNNGVKITTLATTVKGKKYKTSENVVVARVHVPM